MNDVWPLRKLRELAEVRVSSVDKKTYVNERPVKLCNYMDVYSHEYITHDIQFMDASASTAEISRFNVERNDIILTKDSETPDDIGVSTVIIEDFDNLVCGYHLALLKPNKELVNSVYLSKQLSTSHAARYFALCACGSTRFGLPVSAIESILIPLPPQPEQSKIAHILYTVDRAIEQTETLIAKQQRIKSGLMQDLLTRGIDEQGNLRSEKTHQFKDSPLGRIPAEWEIKILSDITIKIADRDHTTPVYVEDGVKMLSPTAFYNDDAIDFERCPCITRLAHIKNSKKTDCSPGDIVLHRIGAGLGRVRVVKNEHPEFSILHSLALIRPKHQYVATSFLKWAFRSFQLEKQMGLGTQSIGVPDLGLEKISSLNFMIPQELKEQRTIARILDEIQKSLDENHHETEKLRALKTALMQDLLTGRKRVTALLHEKEMVNA